MKIALLGGGGWYFSRPIADFAVCPDLAGSRVALYDIDADRAALMAQLGRRLSRQARAGLTFRVAGSLEEAVDGSDFLLCSIGGAGASGSAGYYESPVHLGDKLLCARHGIPQIVGDTAGPAAMMAAFRSVPIYLEICRQAERRAPGAVLLNHANPMAVLCRAMVKQASLPCVIGICHGVQGGIRHAAAILEVDPRELDTIWVGTNHYYWFTRIHHRGRDLLPELWRRVRARPPRLGQQLSQQLSEAFGHWIVYPEDDHIIEFHPYLAQVQDATQLPYGMSEHGFGQRLKPLYAGQQTLAQLRRQDAAASRQAMLRDYRSRLAQIQLPADATDPILGEGTARLIADIAAGRRGVHICNVPNQGSVPNLPREAVLEVEAVTDSVGVRPIWAGEAPPALEALLRKRICWQELVVEAAVHGDRGLALQAMQVDDAAIPPDRSRQLLDALLAHNRGLVPTFERRRPGRGLAGGGRRHQLREAGTRTRRRG